MTLQLRIESRKHIDGLYYASVKNGSADEVFRTDKYQNEYIAWKEARVWIDWCNNLPSGNTDTVYYLLAIPDNFGCSPWIHSFPFATAKVKIGYSRNPIDRVRQLQTGTSDRLILNALEPGGRDLEQQRHQQFAEYRSGGEWFRCAEPLYKHIVRTWTKNRLLPPEHQRAMGELMDEIVLYQATYQVFNSPITMTNPPLDLPWAGKVFLDLTKV